MQDFHARIFCISIHSLVKRETQPIATMVLYKYHFNPLPRKEGDRFESSVRFHHFHFNPLPRKEGDGSLDINRHVD